MVEASQGRLAAEREDARLLLDTWRREADAWAKRIERSDDAAGGLLTACLTVGAVGAAAAGYVQKHAPGSVDLVEYGIGGLCLAGAATLLSRTFGPALIAKTFGRAVVRPEPPRSSDGADLVGALLLGEQQMADDRKTVARMREAIIGVSLLVFALSALLILLGAFTALRNAK